MKNWVSFFQNNTDFVTRKNIVQVDGLKETNQLGLYLGINIIDKGPKI